MANAEFAQDLERFIAEEKFGKTAWERRGLNPSHPALCAKLEAMFNDVATELVAQSRADESPQALKRVLTSFLGATRRSEFDTEEAEFVCAEVARLARMAGVDVGRNLNRWLYGPILGTIVNITRPAKA